MLKRITRQKGDKSEEKGMGQKKKCRRRKKVKLKLVCLLQWEREWQADNVGWWEISCPVKAFIEHL